MKLVFALLVLVNDVPQDPILFADVKMCNTVNLFGYTFLDQHYYRKCVYNQGG